MIGSLRITALVNDRVARTDLLSEHGLSLWIEADGARILFDTGQSDAFARNAGVLGIDIASARAVVLSHGHYDHTGGLATVLRQNSTARLYCHPGVAVPRYSRQPDNLLKPIGMPRESATMLESAVDRTRWVTRPTRLSADMGITGPIPRTSAFEDTGGRFFLDTEGTQTDPIDDDLAMWFVTAGGLVIVTGCCHSGVVNTTEHVRRLNEGLPVHSVVGGLHLLNATPQRIQATGDFLQSIGAPRVVPCHCTGEKAVDALTERFGQRTKWAIEGGVHLFP